MYTHRQPQGWITFMYLRVSRHQRRVFFNTSGFNYREIHRSFIQLSGRRAFHKALWKGSFVTSFCSRRCILPSTSDKWNFSFANIPLKFTPLYKKQLVQLYFRRVCEATIANRIHLCQTCRRNFSNFLSKFTQSPELPKIHSFEQLIPGLISVIKIHYDDWLWGDLRRGVSIKSFCKFETTYRNNSNVIGQMLKTKIEIFLKSVRKHHRDSNSEMKTVFFPQPVRTAHVLSFEEVSYRWRFKKKRGKFVSEDALELRCSYVRSLETRSMRRGILHCLTVSHDALNNKGNSNDVKKRGIAFSTCVAQRFQDPVLNHERKKKLNRPVRLRYNFSSDFRIPS